MQKTSERLLDRNKEFQKSIDPEEFAKSRESFSVELRKSKRLETVLKRRAICTETETSEVPFVLLSIFPQLSNPAVDRRAKLECLIQIFNTQNSYEIVKFALIELRKYLASSDKNPPIQDIFELGFVSYLISFLNQNNPCDIISESAWCLCNLAAGNNSCCLFLVDQGILEAAFPLIDIKNLEISEHIIWCIANLAGESEEIRKAIASYHYIETILDLVEIQDLPLNIYDVSWFCLSNIFRSFAPSIELLESVVRTIKKFLRSKHSNIASNCLFILSYLSNLGKEHANTIINSGILSEILPLMHALEINIQYPAIKIFGNILSEGRQETQALINMRILDYLASTVSSISKKIRKESLFALSNVTAGTKTQIAQAVDHIVMINAMKKLSDSSREVKLEASYVFSNAIHGGSCDSILKLVGSGLLKYVSQALQYSELAFAKNLVFICKGVLDAYEYGLQNKIPFDFDVIDLFKDSGCLEGLEDLKDEIQVQDQGLYNEIVEILSKYFGYGEDEGVQGESERISTYSF
ncbi:unnamed protein product [Blepharisma stoltei]|uniref:Importin subunit alpha n=1 Tax=Blepharisma stoltei TaxID=1481888 RepID=A0AAU9IY43_9CILI|nr:unnamed protein product [Blepharisma stoltei]